MRGVYHEVPADDLFAEVGNKGFLAEFEEWILDEAESAITESTARQYLKGIRTFCSNVEKALGPETPNRWLLIGSASTTLPLLNNHLGDEPPSVGHCICSAYLKVCTFLEKWHGKHHLDGFPTKYDYICRHLEFCRKTGKAAVKASARKMSLMAEKRGSNPSLSCLFLIKMTPLL